MKTKYVLFIAAVLAATSCTYANLFNYATNEDIRYEHSFIGTTIDQSEHLGWVFPSQGDMQITSWGLEESASAWRTVDLKLTDPNVLGGVLSLSGGQVSIYFSAVFGADPTSTGNKLGFMVMSSNSSATGRYMGAFLADKTASSPQARLAIFSDDGGGCLEPVSASEDNIQMTINNMDIDDFRLVYADNGDGTLNITLDRDADQNGTWINLSSVIVGQDSGIDYTDATKFGSTYMERIRLRFRAVYNSVGALAITKVPGTECTAPVTGDLNDDCIVNFKDFAVIAEHWLDCNLQPASACGQ